MTDDNIDTKLTKESWYKMDNNNNTNNKQSGDHVDVDEAELKKIMELLAGNEALAEHILPVLFKNIPVEGLGSKRLVCQQWRQVINREVANRPAIALVAPARNDEGFNTRVLKASISQVLPMSQQLGASGRFGDAEATANEMVSKHWIFDGQHDLLAAELKQAYKVNKVEVIVAILGVHKYVKHVEFFDHKPDRKWLKALAKLSSITSLKLDLCHEAFQPKVSPRAYDFGQNIAALKELKQLQLVNANIDDVGVKLIATLPKLELVRLDGCGQITGDHLSKLPVSLKMLSLCNCRKLAPKLVNKALHAFSKRGVQLELLEIWAMPFVMSSFVARSPSSVSVFKKALELFPNLRVLRYGAYEGLASINIGGWVRLDRLEELAIKPKILGDNEKIQAFFASLFRQPMLALRKLHISGIGWYQTNTLAAGQLESMLAKCPLLEVLDYEDGGEQPLTAAMFASLVHLRQLWLTTEVALAEDEVMALIKQSPHLSFLKLATSPLGPLPVLSKQFVERLTKFCDANTERKLRLSMPHYQFENSNAARNTTTLGEKENLVISFDAKDVPNWG